MAAPTFLTIHPEIRELIYTVYLTTSNSLETESITRENRLSGESVYVDQAVPGWPSDLDNNNPRIIFENTNRYSDPTINPAKPASLSLLLCNRQINVEVTSVIAFLTAHSKKLWYEIDCEIVDEVELYPTWLHIPVRFKDVPIPCLYATFRISGKLDHGARSGWNHGCGGPGPMVWSLLALLNRFLKIGPNFIGFKAASTPSPATVSTIQTSSGKGKLKALARRIFKSGREESNRPSENPEPPLQNQKATVIKIEKLVLDFAPSTLTPEELDARRPTSPYARRMIDPMQVANFLKGQLDYLFDGNRDTFEYGSCIASRVGSVHLRCYGEDLAEWDLAGREVFHKLAACTML